jgi:hypothetical protein
MSMYDNWLYDNKDSLDLQGAGKRPLCTPPLYLYALKRIMESVLIKEAAV